MIEVLPAALDGERVDRVVSLVTGWSRAEAANAVAAGAVRLDGTVVAKVSRRVAAGERLEVDDDAAPVAVELLPDLEVVLRVVHEDADVVVVDKPAGLVVHPGAGHDRGTLVGGLVARYPELVAVGVETDAPLRPGIVHRLDAGTSGLLVVARTVAAYHDLVGQLAARRVTRVYDALVWGHPSRDRGVIDAPIGRDPREPTRMAVVADGKPARTGYRVVTRYPDPVVARLECRLETGRTHQIRVHLAAIGHPVVGDERYRGRRSGLPVGLERPFLHATELAFDHPTSGERCSFSSPLPVDLRALLDAL